MPGFRVCLLRRRGVVPLGNGEMLFADAFPHIFERVYVEGKRSKPSGRTASTSWPLA